MNDPSCFSNDKWVDGYRLTDASSLARYNLEPSKLVNTLVQCSLKQVLENGYFHAGELFRWIR
jgi:aarF domain-containing kinase